MRESHHGASRDLECVRCLAHQAHTYVFKRPLMDPYLIPSHTNLSVYASWHVPLRMICILHKLLYTHRLLVHEDANGLTFWPWPWCVPSGSKPPSPPSIWTALHSFPVEKCAFMHARMYVCLYIYQMIQAQIFQQIFENVGVLCNGCNSVMHCVGPILTARAHDTHACVRARLGTFA